MPRNRCFYRVPGLRKQTQARRGWSCVIRKRLVKLNWAQIMYMSGHHQLGRQYSEVFKEELGNMTKHLAKIGNPKLTVPFALKSPLKMSYSA